MLPVSDKVYNLFESELKKSVEDALNFLNVTPSEQEKRLKALGTQFHTIKGGAGFLGFAQVASKAGELETLLLKSSEALSRRLEKAEQVIKEFANVVENLPSRETKPSPDKK